MLCRTIGRWSIVAANGYTTAKCRSEPQEVWILMWGSRNSQNGCHDSISNGAPIWLTEYEQSNRGEKIALRGLPTYFPCQEESAKQHLRPHPLKPKTGSGLKGQNWEKK